MRTGGPGPWLTVAVVTAYVVLAGIGLAVLVATGTDAVAVVVLAVVATGVLAGVLVRALGRTSTAVRKVVADMAVMVDANPSHRVGAVDTRDLEPLVGAVNRLAESRESALSGAAEAAAATRRDVESERNRLAALMGQLTVAVVVCNSEGRILLYNGAARSLLGETTPVGLGRSVFGVVDRGLVAHAQARLASGAETVHTATTLHGDRMFRVRVTLVHESSSDGSETGSGFVLVLEDLTREVRAGDERERLMRHLTESTRASLGGIRAAAESVLDFPDLSADERQAFLEIVRDEADRLGRRVDALAAGVDHGTDDRVVGDITGDDLLTLLRGELSRQGIEAVSSPPPPDLWLRVDGYSVSRAVGHVIADLVQHTAVGMLALTLEPTGRHAALDARWQGRAPSPSVVDGWLDHPLDGSGTTRPRDVVARHGAEIWCGDLDDATAYLRVLLPLASGTTPAPAPAGPVEVTSRPEFYDFDLFTTGSQSPDLFEQRLDQMTFTVFDTETTGLEPRGGDRIISIGAVRVVNGRVLRQETFERLVHPGRPVPAPSTAIHGITDEMLTDAPPISEVLPEFARFAEDTVLVGHNVSFDLQFVALAGPSAGVELTQPALDTLLLHAALHPDHESHTLEAIAAELGVDVVGRHTALGDALVTAEVFIGLVALLRSQGIQTLADAASASRRTYQSRVDERRYGA